MSDDHDDRVFQVVSLFPSVRDRFDDGSPSFIFQHPVDTLQHVETNEYRSHVISLRICLLTTQDLDADPFPEDDWPCDPRPFYPDAEWHVETLVGKVDSVARVETLIKSDKFDLFSICATARRIRTFPESK